MRALDIVRYWLKDKLQPSFHRPAFAARLCVRTSVDPNLVMYEAYNGRDFSGNPHALLAALLRDPGRTHLQHVIAVDDAANPIAKRYAHHPRVTIVQTHSDAYIRAAETCQVFINNASWKPYLVKRPGQIYVTSWHSTLLKPLARDAQSPWDGKNVTRSLIASDVFLSPNIHTAENLYRSHGADGIAPGAVAHLGYPRNDFLFNTDRGAVRAKLGVGVHQKLVLYAPTWRGAYTPEDTVGETMRYLDEMRAALGNDVVVLAKLHTLVYRFISDEYRQHLAPMDLDTNELLAAADVLITDYSGIFFDFLVTSRPIIFFMPDRREYEAAKGSFYLDLDSLPGPQCQTASEAAELAADTSWSQDFRDRYGSYIAQFVADDDGKASQRAIELIFDGAHKDRCSTMLSSRQKLLIYPANLAGNGVTESILALLNEIDYSRFDVVVQLPSPSKYQANQLRVNPNAKIVYQTAPDGYTPREFHLNRRLVAVGVSRREQVPVAAYERTERRLFGDLTFDAVVNFNGYFPNAAAKMATGPRAGRRLIYLHNDLERDRQIKHPQLHAVFSTYQFYDQLVCVSADSLEANRDAITPYVREAFGVDISNRWTFARNLIDVDRIRDRASQGEIVQTSDVPYILIPSSPKESSIAVPFAAESTRYAAIGRLSPEKNHTRLLQAFNRVVQSGKAAHLYVIGTGKLEKSLKALAGSLGIDEHVTFTGFVANPLAVLSRCHYLVSASDIEGQPITVLESLTLGVPVIATNIEGPRGLLEAGGGELVDISVDGVAEAMLRATKIPTHNPEQQSFDAHQYVGQAMQEFLANLEG